LFRSEVVGREELQTELERAAVSRGRARDAQQLVRPVERSLEPRGSRRSVVGAARVGRAAAVIAVVLARFEEVVVEAQDPAAIDRLAGRIVGQRGRVGSRGSGEYQ